MKHDANYVVEYPSGKTFAAVGRYLLNTVGDFLIPCIITELGETLALDQRAIVRRDGDVMVYTPRMNLDGLTPTMTEWVKLNPHWAPTQKTA